MDERASSMLGMGNSMLNQQEAQRRTMDNNIGVIKGKTADRMNTLKGDRSTAREEDMGFDAKDGFTALGDVQRFSASVGRASKLYQDGPVIQKTGELLKAGRNEGMVAKATLLAREPSAVGTLKTFVFPSFRGAEATRTAGDVATRVGEIGAEGEATTKAASGVPRVIGRIAEVAGESGKSAAAIGDVVGHGLGIAMAGVNIAKDVSGGWSSMDEKQKAGNVLGIAGGIADAISMAIPIFTPLAVGLNIASSVESYEGDNNAPAWAMNRKGGLKDQQAKLIASQRADLKASAPTSVTSSGQVAQKTVSATPQNQGVAAF